MGADIWDGYANWSEVAKQDPLDVVKQKITGAAEWAPNHVPPGLRAFLETLAAAHRAQGMAAAVLDFGCGLGRNGPLLRRFFPRVVGYDLPEMMARFRSPLLEGARFYDALYDDLDALAGAEAVTVLYDSVVFQHILDVPAVRDILSRLLRIPSLGVLVTLKNEKVEETALQRLLRQRGWKEVLAEHDEASFQGALHGIRHDVVVARRPQGAG